jgi:hypothetical protein
MECQPRWPPRMGQAQAPSETRGLGQPSQAHLQMEASPHLLSRCRHAETRCCLSPPSRQVVPLFSPTHVPPTLFPHCEQPLGPPPARSHSKRRASRALVKPPTGKTLEPPTYASCSKTIEFRAQAQEVRSYEKRLTTFYMHILGKWEHAALGASLLGETWIP